MSLRIAFAGTPLFACAPLKKILDSSHSVVAVYTQPDRPSGRGRSVHFNPVKQLALSHQIPLYQPVHLKSPTEQEIFKHLNPDIFIVVAYGLILPSAILAIPKFGCINIHASLLPLWRGAAPIQHAILAGDKITGVSIMQMDAGLDTGDILSLHACPLDPDDNSQTLQEKLSDLGANAIIDTLAKLGSHNISKQKQDHSKATYAGKISKEDARINWQENASTLDRKIRAFNPWPIAYSELHNQNVRIWSAKPTPFSSNLNPGTIIESGKDGILVATGNGSLQLLELQLSGGKPLPVRDILNSKRAFFQTGLGFN